MWTERTSLFGVLVGIVCSLLLPTMPTRVGAFIQAPDAISPGTTENLQVFRDDFNGEALDPNLWQIYENGGTVEVSDGFLTLADRSPSTTFPYVHGKSNPFPQSGNFSLKVGVQYLEVTGNGTGLVSDDFLPPIGPPQWGPAIYVIWQDSRAGFLLQDYSWTMRYLQPAPHLSYHEIEFRWLDSWDEYYVDGELVASVARDAATPRPTVVWFGNPTIQELALDWTSFRLDYVEVRSLGESFLDLPVSYEVFEVAATGSNRGTGPGRVNSWFDHQYPYFTHSVDCSTHPELGPQHDNRLSSWTGIDSIPPSNVCECALGSTCYDGHNGTDFRHALSGDEPVLAAAAGTVIDVISECQYERNCGGFGNQVWIDHGNCYSTLYAHLDRVEMGIANDVVVSQGQQIGIMGNTGFSTGIHLHFGVYKDPDCDGDWSVKDAVDPYGWASASTDPWPVNTTQPLWMYALGPQDSLGTAGGTLSTPSGTYAANIPPGALSETVTMELLATPPISEPSAGLRSAGYSLWLRVLEWLLPDQVADSVPKGVSLDAFAEPISLTVNYADADVVHLNEEQLSIFRWDESQSSWLQLPGTIDTAANTAEALTTEPGSFSLHAPLTCTEDSSEPDDNYDSASSIPLDGSMVTRLFDTAQDEDWFRLPALRGAIYTLETGNLASDVDTVLELYGLDGTTLLAADDNGGAGQASHLEWQAPTNGIFFVRVGQAGSSENGCEASYDLSVHVKYMIYLPLVMR